MKRRRRSGRSSNQSASSSDGDVQVAGEASAAAPCVPATVRVIQHDFKVRGPIDKATRELIFNCIHERRPDPAIFRTPSIATFELHPGETMEERKTRILSFFDLLAEKKRAIVEKKGTIVAKKRATASSGVISNIAHDEGGHSDKRDFSEDIGMITQNEDEHSDSTRPSSGDLVKMIAHDEDEQHSTKIDFHAIEERKQEHGDYVQSLLDMDVDNLVKKVSYYLDQLKVSAGSSCPLFPSYNDEQLIEVYDQLALYRIRGYKLSVEQQLEELDDANLKKHYPPQVLYENEYFEHYEESLDWYFDLELCKRPDLDDYQRLMLYDRACEYHDLDCYRSNLCTYEQDLAYVNYCAELAKKTKWIGDYLVAHSGDEWRKLRDVAYLQAVEIAAGLSNVSREFACSAYREHMRSIQADYRFRDIDNLYFEIWKRITQQKKDFRAVLSELHGENMFPLRSTDIKNELENTPYRLLSMERDYDSCVACIGETVSEDKARQLIIDAVRKMVRKPKIYLDYARRKLDIAKGINLIPKDSV